MTIVDRLKQKYVLRLDELIQLGCEMPMKQHSQVSRLAVQITLRMKPSIGNLVLQTGPALLSGVRPVSQFSILSCPRIAYCEKP